jgi:hypothetical protein
MTAKLTHRIDTWMSPDVANAIEAIAQETDQSTSAVVRYLVVSGLSSIGRMPPRAARPNGQAA